MKRQKRVSVIAIYEVDRTKWLPVVLETIHTTSESGEENELEVYNLPNKLLCDSGDSVPEAAEKLIEEITHLNFEVERSFPIVPSCTLRKEDTVEHFIVFGYLTGGKSKDSMELAKNTYLISEMEVFYRLGRQANYEENFREGKFIGIDSVHALSIANTMNILSNK